MKQYFRDWKGIWKKLGLSEKFSLVILLFLLLVFPVAILLAVNPVRLFTRATYPITPPITSPITPTLSPYQNSIWWITEDVYLTSENFYISANGITFHDNSWPMFVTSEPSQPGTNVLDVLWHENERDMRVNMLFRQDGVQWWLDELKFYDGRIPAGWYTFDASWIRAPLGVAYRNSIDLSAVPTNPSLGTIHFTNIELLPFRRFVVPTVFPITPLPTSGSCDLMGDANGDCRVDGLDYAIWFISFGRITQGGPRDGDFDRSGSVDGLDYAIWYINYARY